MAHLGRERTHIHLIAAAFPGLLSGYPINTTEEWAHALYNLKILVPDVLPCLWGGWKVFLLTADWVYNWNPGDETTCSDYPYTVSFNTS